MILKDAYLFEHIFDWLRFASAGVGYFASILVLLLGLIAAVLLPFFDDGREDVEQFCVAIKDLSHPGLFAVYACVFVQLVSDRLWCYKLLLHGGVNETVSKG